MIKGVALGFLTYFLFSGTDAISKHLGQHISVFEISCITSIAGLATLPFIRNKGESWRIALHMNRPMLVLLRAGLGVIATLLGMVAFTTLPLAEAYSLLFLMPLFVTLLSIVLLKEMVGWRRWLAIFIGLAGVLLVVRPGVRELLPGHFAAVGAALCAAGTIIVLRVLGGRERKTAMFATANMATVLVAGAAMLLDFQMPSPSDWFFLILSGLLGGVGNVCLLWATQFAPANRVAPTQYAQIVWAILLGAVFFGEFPDGWALAGMGLVLASGLFTFLREEQRGSFPARSYLLRNRP